MSLSFCQIDSGVQADSLSATSGENALIGHTWRLRACCRLAMLLVCAGLIAAAGSGCARHAAESSAESMGSARGLRGLGHVERRELSRLWAKPGAWQLERDDDLAMATGSSRRQHASENRWGHMIHRIRVDDTLYGLSLAYYGRVSHWRAIYRANQETLESPERLTPGQRLYLPTEPLREPNGQCATVRRVPDYYVVAPGDTLSEISRKMLGTPHYAAILEANKQQFANSERPELEAGMVLVMPTSR